jgi:Flp pilus assembly protein TadD
LSPDYADGENNLGRALFREGEIDKAIACWRKTLSLYPDDADAHASLGDALLQKGRVRDAVAHYERSREIDPQWPPVLNALAWVLSTCSDREFRNGPRAIQLAEQANQLSGGKNPAFIRTLGAAYAESGRFTDAIDAAQRALELSVAKGDAAFASNLRMDIDLYRMNFPRR